MWKLRVEVYLNNVVKYSLTLRFIKYVMNLMLSVICFVCLEPMMARKAETCC